MTNQVRELSIDDLGTVSGGGDDFNLGSLPALEAVRLDGTKDSTTMATTQAPIRQSVAKPTPIIKL